jgi:transcriptional regulator
MRKNPRLKRVDDGYTDIAGGMILPTDLHSDNSLAHAHASRVLVLHLLSLPHTKHTDCAVTTFLATMYIRAEHAERDLPALREFVHAYPLGTLTTAIDCAGIDTLQSTHIPWVLSASDDDDESSNDILRGHMARANPQSKALISAIDSEGYLPNDVLILFTAPVHAYTSARWMVASKAKDTGNGHKVAPTWQFAAVQVYGRVRVFSWDKTDGPTRGAAAEEWLETQLTALTRQQERKATEEGAKGREWHIEEAARGYVNALKKGIIGLEVEVTKIEGRFKLGQDENDGDWEGIVDGFENLGTAAAEEMVGMMRKSARGSRPGCPV